MKAALEGWSKKSPFNLSPAGEEALETAVIYAITELTITWAGVFENWVKSIDAERKKKNTNISYEFVSNNKIKPKPQLSKENAKRIRR